MVSSYSTEGDLTDLYLRPGTEVTVSIWDRDAFFDDHLASLAGNVPPTLRRARGRCARARQRRR
ncbi:hypothetical protein [Nannocystis pusilla]|uniref:hypothetical protein n=1 Tax=Nannocystis pusilla TaxID=889268 RepID=UPI003B81B54B